MPVADQLRAPPSRRRLRGPADGRELSHDRMAMRNSARATRAAGRSDRAQEPRRRAPARRTRRHQGTDARRARSARHPRNNLRVHFSRRRIRTRPLAQSLRPRTPRRGHSVRRRQRSRLSIGAVPARVRCLSQSLRTRRRFCRDDAINCPVAERLFEHAIVSIPHECLLGDDRDVDDIVAAAAKVASRATELAEAKFT